MVNKDSGVSSLLQDYFLAMMSLMNQWAIRKRQKAKGKGRRKGQ